MPDTTPATTPPGGTTGALDPFVVLLFWDSGAAGVARLLREVFCK